MALNDWNGNGKKDIGDDFIEYQIYKDVTEDEKHEEPMFKSNMDSGTTIIAVLIAIGVMVLLGWILSLF